MRPSAVPLKSLGHAALDLLQFAFLTVGTTAAIVTATVLLFSDIR
jgi:hypothetical protein